MNRKLIAACTLSVLVGMLLGALIYPIVNPPPEPPADHEEDSAWRQGEIRVVGSSTVLPMSSASAIAFMEKYSRTVVTVEGGGSGRGYKEVIEGRCDIGTASRRPKSKEVDAAKETGVPLILHEIAVDAVCVIVHPSVTQGIQTPIGLTLQEVGKIYAGEYERWNQVRPDLPDEEIVIITREAGSGTRGIFEKHCLEEWGYQITAAAREQPGNPKIRESVRLTPNSVGYVGLGFLTEGVVAIPLSEGEGLPYVEPTVETASSGEYPLSRFLYFATAGRPESGSLTDRFIDFVRSPEGQVIATEEGLIPLPDYP